MTICKQTMEELFSIGEVISLTHGSGAAFRVASIGDDRIQLQPASSEAKHINLDYSQISNIIDAGGENASENDSAVHGFAAEYLRRAEEARRDAEVEAMWLSAGVCQIQ